MSARFKTIQGIHLEREFITADGRRPFRHCDVTRAAGQNSIALSSEAGLLDLSSSDPAILTREDVGTTLQNLPQLDPVESESRPLSDSRPFFADRRYSRRCHRRSARFVPWTHYKVVLSIVIISLSYAGDHLAPQARRGLLPCTRCLRGGPRWDRGAACTAALCTIGPDVK